MFFTYYSLQCPLRIGRTLFKFNNFPLSRKTISTTSIRSEVFNIGKRMKNELQYKKMDKIEPTYELIYRAPFEYLTACCRHVPTVSLLLVSSAIAYKLAIGVDVIAPNAEVVIGPMMSDGFELSAMVFAFYAVNVGLSYFVTKYPLRIYKLKNQYCAVFEGFVPFSRRQYTFQKGDVCKAKSLMPWDETMFKMKDRSVLVLAHHFRKPSDFNDMLRK